jgi:CRP/FNR family cyclic AMP-dependent transcriptional regulator
MSQLREGESSAPRGVTGDLATVGPVLYFGSMETSRVAAIPLFADLPEDELAAVASVAAEVEIASGQALAAEGHLGHSLFAIESGTADVVMDGATVRTIGAGDVVGEIAVFASRPDPFAPPEVAEGGLRSASVVATSPMRLIALFKRDVWALDRRAPVATQRLRAMVDEHREQDILRALAERHAQDAQGGSPGSDPLAG